MILSIGIIILAISFLYNQIPLGFFLYFLLVCFDSSYLKGDYIRGRRDRRDIGSGIDSSYSGSSLHIKRSLADSHVKQGFASGGIVNDPGSIAFLDPKGESIPLGKIIDIETDFGAFPGHPKFSKGTVVNISHKAEFDLSEIE